MLQHKLSLTSASTTHDLHAQSMCPIDVLSSMLHLVLASLRIECGKCSGYFGYQHQQKNARPPADQIADLDEKIKVGGCSCLLLRLHLQSPACSKHLSKYGTSNPSSDVEPQCNCLQHCCGLPLLRREAHRSLGLQVAKERLTYLTRRKQHKAKREQQKRVNVLEDRRQV